MSTLTTQFKNYLDVISDAFQLTTLNALFWKLVILTMAFLSPISNIIFGVVFLVLCDLVTGVVAAYRKKEKITSSKLSRTISKLLVYFVTVIITRVVSDYLLFGSDVIPLTSMVTSYIALTELKSILENLDKMSKGQHSALGSIIRALSNEKMRADSPAVKRIKDKPKPKRK